MLKWRLEMLQTIRPSHVDLIEEADQAELIQIREWDCLMRFRVGDIANKYALLSAGRGLRVPDSAIHEAVGRFCGKTGRTVRYYAEQAAFYSPDVRATYNAVPFSVFVLARRCGPAWADVLEYALLHPLASEAEIERKFLGPSLAGPPDGDGLSSRGERPEPEAMPAAAGAGSPEADALQRLNVAAGLDVQGSVPLARHALVRMASDLLGVLEQLGREARLPPAAQDALASGVASIRQALIHLADAD
jgi:hypothetical protein